jgi:hypothetical protein
MELLFGRYTRTPFRARARGVRTRHAQIRGSARLRSEDPLAPINLDPSHVPFERRRLRSLRDRGQRKQEKRQKPGYSHSIVAGGLDEMS